MAKVLGESGRYVSQQATKRLHTIWARAIITMAVVGGIAGFTIRSSFPSVTLAPVNSMLLSVLLVLVMCLVGSLSFRRMDELSKERERMQKGAAGENLVAHTLSNLPDEFLVINDVPTPRGNLDHVVIGPTGVFIIETKNWRGIIGSDEKDKLTWNGKSLKTDYVKICIGRMMATKERVQVLAPGVDPFFQAVMVFTSAWVSAKIGTTGRVHCIRDDRLLKYIDDNKSRNKLSAREVKMIAQAFSSLAWMDPDFRAGAEMSAEGKAAAENGTPSLPQNQKGSVLELEKTRCAV